MVDLLAEMLCLFLDQTSRVILQEVLRCMHVFTVTLIPSLLLVLQ